MKKPSDQIHLHIPATPVIYCDNIRTIYLSANLVFHSRMKHIAINFHLEQILDFLSTPA